MTITATAARPVEPSPGADVAALSVLVAVEDERWRAVGLGDLDAFCSGAARAAARSAGLAPGIETELGITLTNDAAVRRLNADWRAKDKPTNVLSFPLTALMPGDQPGPLLGDVVLAFETVAREAADEGKPFAHHACHLVVHGTLHCFGHDHALPGEAERMEALETRVLAALGIPDPYAATEPAALSSEEEPRGA